MRIQTIFCKCKIFEKQNRNYTHIWQFKGNYVIIYKIIKKCNKRYKIKIRIFDLFRLNAKMLKQMNRSFVEKEKEEEKKIR